MDDGAGGAAAEAPSQTQVVPVDLASAISTVALAALPVLVLQAVWRRCSRRREPPPRPTAPALWPAPRSHGDRIVSLAE